MGRQLKRRKNCRFSPKALLSVPVLPLVIVLVLVAWEMFQPNITIEPIALPQSLTHQGYKAEQLATEIIAHLDTIRKTTERPTKYTKFQLSSRKQDLPIPTTDTTLKNVAAYFHNRFNMQRHVTITGNIRQSHRGYSMRLLIHQQNTVQLEIDSANDIDRLLRDGALEILAELEPYFYIKYRFKQTLLCPEDRELRIDFSDLVSDVVANRDLDSDVRGAALVLLGNLLSHEGDGRTAVEKYEQAIDEFESVWAYAAWGGLLLEQREYRDAIERFEEATKRNRKYAAAYTGWGEGAVFLEGTSRSL